MSRGGAFFLFCCQAPRQINAALKFVFVVPRLGRHSGRSKQQRGDSVAPLSPWQLLYCPHDFVCVIEQALKWEQSLGHCHHPLQQFRTTNAMRKFLAELISSPQISAPASPFSPNAAPFGTRCLPFSGAARASPSKEQLFLERGLSKNPLSHLPRCGTF